MEGCFGKEPRIAVVVPVYNEERFVADALRSALDQEYGNFDVLVSDNCSTDGSVPVVQALIEGRSNAFLIRQERNVGSMENITNLWEEAARRGGYDYICTVGAHDLLHPGYLAKLSAALEERPECPLAYFKVRYVDEDGQELQVNNFCDYVYPGVPPMERYLRFLDDVHECTCVNGMMRFGAIGIPKDRFKVRSGDIVLLARMILGGPFVRIEEVLYTRRMFEPKTDSRPDYDTRVLPGKNPTNDGFMDSYLTDMWDILEGPEQEKLEVSLLIFAIMARKWKCSLPAYFATMRRLTTDLDSKVLALRGRTPGFTPDVEAFLLEEARGHSTRRITESDGSDGLDASSGTKPFHTVLFVYNRPDHAAAVIGALRRDKVQNLIVHSDAPATPAQEDAVRRTRLLLESIDWTVPRLILRETNAGLARSIDETLEDLFSRHDRVVVLEDDCVPGPFFFDYMARAFDAYDSDKSIQGISGFTIPLPEELVETNPCDAYLFPRMSTWAWGTWRDRWLDRSRNLLELLARCEQEGIDLSQGGTDILRFLGEFLEGTLQDVWSLHWLLEVYLRRGAYVYPNRTLIENIGLDGSGAHGETGTRKNGIPSPSPVLRFPRPALPLDASSAAIARHFREFCGQETPWTVERIHAKAREIRVHAGATGVMPGERDGGEMVAVQQVEDNETIARIDDMVSRGMAALQAGAPEEAFEWARRAEETGVPRMGVSMLRAVAQLHLGKREDSLVSMEKEVRSFPENRAALDALNTLRNMASGIHGGPSPSSAAPKEGFFAEPTSKVNPGLVAWKPGCSVVVGNQCDVWAMRVSFDRPGCRLRVGNRTFVGHSHFVCAEDIEVGDDVLMSWGCTILDHDSHSTDFTLRSNDVVGWLKGEKDWTHVRRARVRIGNKAWIGLNVLIMKGVTIGEGGVVAAGSVVTRDVAPWTLVAGNPARFVKELPRPDGLSASLEDALPHSATDAYDTAYNWGWNEGGLRELIRSCYKTPDQPENARRYHASPEFDAACEELKRAGHPPSRGTRILDIGCGNGVACWSLAKEGYEVTGIDSRPGALTGIGAARKLIGKDGSIFKILHTPAGKLPFAPATFDVVWMREELHHIRDLSGFLSSVLELLVPGGVILAMRDPVVWNESQKAAFFEDHPFHRFTNDENCHYLDEYIEGFARAGFTLEKMLDPVSSPINTYPGPFSELATFDVEAARLRPRGNDLFSFLARKSPA